MGLLLLVRHGQASFGADDYDVLSETGWAQGRLLGRWLAERDVVPTALVRGGMRRHRETLEAMAETAGWDLADDAVTVDADWDEFDHLGIVANFPDLPSGPMDRREFQAVFEQATARWTADAPGDYPETFAAFRRRGLAALDRAAALAGSGQTVVAVTSGGVIAAVCAALVDPDAGDEGDPAVAGRLWQRFNTVVVNSAVTRVVVGASGARLLTFNEHPHLDDAHRTYR